MNRNSGCLRVNRVDLLTRQITAGSLSWRAGRIVDWQGEGAPDDSLPWLLPGFIDAHVHIESSLLPPSEFARLALPHGTVASVSDPHEIANVLGIEGVRWMLANAATTPFKVLFGAPSCVPATGFESAGATLGAAEIGALLDQPGVGYLSEVMNFPGVLAGDPELLAKMAEARRRHLPIDGHAPGLRGEAAAAYVGSGITSDHECTDLGEAEDKLRAGMSILIREGSAARDFLALHSLISAYPGQVMLCTDDCHPDDLAQGHIDRLVARACALGHDLFTVLDCACLTPQRHYGLDIGCLQVGEAMTGVLVADLRDFQVLSTWMDGEQVAANGQCLLPPVLASPINRFAAQPLSVENLQLRAGRGDGPVDCRVIVAAEGLLYTREAVASLLCRNGIVAPDPDSDTLLIAVVNRYQPAPPAIALVRGFGLQRGALASSVAHDSHNLIAVGCDAASLAVALNAVIATQGGLAVFDGEALEVLPLPLAGLMSDGDGRLVAEQYAGLTEMARSRLGTTLRAPFMTLAFMALLVIPELKLSDLGLFDGRNFRLTEVLCPA